jgi:hypothetical protein
MREICYGEDVCLSFNRMAILDASRELGASAKIFD